MQDEAEKTTKLIICCCTDYQLIAKEKIQMLYTAAREKGLEVELCADFCLETIKNPDKLKALSASKTILAACYQRAVKAFFHRNKIPAPKLVDLRHQNIEEVIKKLGLNIPEQIENIELPEYTNNWRAWYPLIDNERCSQCGKCVDFCFFGAYEKKAQEVQVASPENCKTDCPACARMCPNQAIIFPKHTDAPVNGGVIQNSEQNSENKKNLFDENLYAKLAARRRAQKSRNLLKEEPL